MSDRKGKAETKRRRDFARLDELMAGMDATRILAREEEIDDLAWRFRRGGPGGGDQTMRATTAMQGAAEAIPRARSQWGDMRRRLGELFRNTDDLLADPKRVYRLLDGLLCRAINDMRAVSECERAMADLESGPGVTPRDTKPAVVKTMGAAARELAAAWSPLIALLHEMNETARRWQDGLDEPDADEAESA